MPGEKESTRLTRDLFRSGRSIPLVIVFLLFTGGFDNANLSGGRATFTRSFVVDYQDEGCEFSTNRVLFDGGGDIRPPVGNISAIISVIIHRDDLSRELFRGKFVV